MIETLKSELKLRPTYDELVGMIESQGDPNRPPIEKIIDRRATIFRNNQFGSQFDNLDFLGLKKQEEDKLKEEQRQNQLRRTAIGTGTSLGLLNARQAQQSGTSTPLTADTASSMRDMTVEELDAMTAGMIRDELEREQRRHDESMVLARARASTELDKAHSQSLPVGVMDASPEARVLRDDGEEEDDMPPLEDIPQEEEGEEEKDFEEDEEVDDTQQIMQILDSLKMNGSVKANIKFDLQKMNLNDWSTISPKLMTKDTLTTMFVIAEKMGKLNNEQKEAFDTINEKIKATGQDTPEHTQAMNEARELFIIAFHDDDPELIPADADESTKAPNQPRKHKETIDYSTKITKWQDKSVQEEDIRFQLFLRGIELTPEQEEELSKLKVKGKGRNQTRKDYLINYVDRLIQTGKWTDQVNDQLLQKRMVEWREMKKGKGKGSSSSSGIGGAIASGAKAVGGAVLDAGKEAVKEAVVAGARSAVMSLI